MTIKISDMTLFPNPFNGTEEFEIAIGNQTFKVTSLNIADYVSSAITTTLQEAYDNGFNINIDIAGDPVTIVNTDNTGGPILKLLDHNSVQGLFIESLNGGQVISEYDLNFFRPAGAVTPQNPWVDTGAAKVFKWNRQKTAFRAGECTGTQFNSNNVGFTSFAFGLDVIAAADHSITFGRNASLLNTATNSFMFSDGSNPVFSQAQPDTFNVRATGGAVFDIGPGASDLRVGDIAEGDHVEISSTGIFFLGSAQYSKYLYLYPEDCTALGDNFPERTVLFDTISALRFLPSVKRSIFFNRLRDLGFNQTSDTQLTIGWAPADNTAGDVKFSIEILNASPGDTLGPATITDTITDATSGVINQIQESNITIVGGFGATIVSGIKLSRDGDDVADTYAGAVNILYIRFSYLMETM